MVSIPQRLLGEALFNSARNNPSKTAIIVKDESYSYERLKTDAENLAHHLIKSGLIKGDRVAIYLDNSWESVISIYGVLLAGAVFLMINPQTKSDKLKYILNDSGAKTLITSVVPKNEFLHTVKDTPAIQEIIVTGDLSQIRTSPPLKLINFGNAIEEKKAKVILPNIIPNDLAALIYTSGSTGFPKGVMMTHQAMVFTSWSLIQYLRLSENDRIILLLPLAFDYGLYQLLMTITIGGTLIVEHSFIFFASIYEHIEKYKPTVFPGVPTMYAMMIASNKESRLSFDCIEKITSTAADLPAEFIPGLQKIFPNALIYKMYGLTECKRVCYLEPELINVRPASVGKAIPGTEAFLLSPEGNPVPAEEPGILYIRGPHVMLGYWNNEELSKQMLKPGKLPGEKILCSNDWFKMDEEGFLYFLGRNDDIIKTRGEKVSPVEVENVIYAIEGIKEVAILGIPDKIMGESIVAFVTTNSTTQLNEKIIHRKCTAQLESFMVPGKIILMEEMPKNANGKIDKKELKKLLQNELYKSRSF